MARLFADFSLLYRNKNFALLYVGQFLSFFGTMITSVALPYQIYMATHSTLMVGLVSLVQLLPLLVTALVGGVFADRYHRRMLLYVAESVLLIGSILLAWNAYNDPQQIWPIFILSFFMSAFNGLHRPALESMVQQIVSRQDFTTCGALTSFKVSISMIVGPAIGGIIIASFGLFITYLIDSLTFVISLSCLALMTYPQYPLTVADDESTWTALKQGIRYAFSRQELVGTYVIDFIAMIFGMPIALFPALAAAYHNTVLLGMLYSAPAVGALIISLFSGWTQQIKRHGVAIAWAATFWGVAIIGFGLAVGPWHNMVLALFFLVLAGSFDGISGIFRTTMWNETIPTELRGRLAGIEMISYLSGPRLGDTEAGLVAAMFGVTASIVSGGVLCVVGVAGCCVFLPKFLQYRSAD